MQISRQRILTCLVVLLLVTLVQPCFAQANYEAANWNVWFVNQSKIPGLKPPPSAKSELPQVKRHVAQLSDEKREAAIHWNAVTPAYRWNQVATKVISWEKFEQFARFPSSWMNIAIHDALIIAWKEKLKHKRQRPQQTDPSIKTLVPTPSTYSYPCEYAVTAAAASTVLAYFLPEKADSLIAVARKAAQSRVDVGVAFPSDIEAGWQLGEAVARDIIEKAKKDGSDVKWDGQMNKDPKKWTGQFPLGITLAKFHTIALNTADQFRPPAPPDFEKDMAELKNFKRNFNSNAQAYFWAADGGVGFWNKIFTTKAVEYGLAGNAPLMAKMYAILSIGSHDAAIAVMDAKYAYWGIRPNQYDTTYKSLIMTPPFPGYPSGHAVGTATTATILSAFFPADKEEFEKLAKDCAESRFFAGIHFRTDNEVGLEMGKSLGNYIVQTLLKK